MRGICPLPCTFLLGTVCSMPASKGRPPRAPGRPRAIGHASRSRIPGSVLVCLVYVSVSVSVLVLVLVVVWVWMWGQVWT